jgi:hypothetical protein
LVTSARRVEQDEDEREIEGWGTENYLDQIPPGSFDFRPRYLARAARKSGQSIDGCAPPGKISSVSYYNPYGPPPPLQPYGAPYGGGYGAAPLYGPSGECGIWREGYTLAVWPWGSQFPDRCVCCNAPANGRRYTKTLYWHPPVVYLGLLGGLLIYWILEATMRKQVTVSVGLCAAHDQRRKLGLGLAWGGFALFFVLMLVGASQGSPEIMLLSLALMVICPIVGAILARVISPVRIEQNQAWLKVGPAFLDSVPQGPPGMIPYPQAW